MHLLVNKCLAERLQRLWIKYFASTSRPAVAPLASAQDRTDLITEFGELNDIW